MMCWLVLEHIFLHLFKHPPVHMICVHTCILPIPATLVTKGSYGGSELDGLALLSAGPQAQKDTRKRFTCPLLWNGGDFPTILGLCRLIRFLDGTFFWCLDGTPSEVWHHSQEFNSPNPTKDSDMESLDLSDKEGEPMKEETTGGDCE